MTVLTAGVDSLFSIFTIQYHRFCKQDHPQFQLTTLTLNYFFKYLLYQVNNNNLEQYFLGVSFYQTSSTYKGLWSDRQLVNMLYEDLVQFNSEKLQRANKNHNLISKSDLNPYDKFE